MTKSTRGREHLKRQRQGKRERERERVVVLW